MVKFLAVIALAVSGPSFQSGAKAMFYDPGGGRVGIHFWFETESGEPFGESRAATTGGRFRMHVRNNVGAGFLTIWLIEGESSVELTPRAGRYPGQHMTDLEFVVPDYIQFDSGDGERRLILVFARSQSEVAGSAPHARQRLEQITGRTGPGGPDVIRESDEATPGQIGTYVVSQSGAPVATEIALRRKSSGQEW